MKLILYGIKFVPYSIRIARFTSSYGRMEAPTNNAPTDVWMTKSDPAILELVEETEIPMPPAVASYNPHELPTRRLSDDCPYLNNMAFYSE